MTEIYKNNINKVQSLILLFLHLKYLKIADKNDMNLNLNLKII